MHLSVFQEQQKGGEFTDRISKILLNMLEDNTRQNNTCQWSTCLTCTTPHLHQEDGSFGLFVIRAQCHITLKSKETKFPTKQRIPTRLWLNINLWNNTGDNVFIFYFLTVYHILLPHNCIFSLVLTTNHTFGPCMRIISR